jgi:ABC-2 type transport system ATP-binding protein
MQPQDSIPFELRNVTKSFLGNAVLRDLSWQVASGSIVGLLGANGAGKTTLLKILLGLIPPDAGVAAILGADAQALPPEVRERVGYVPQAPNLFGWLTGKAMLRYVGSFYPRYDAARADAIAQRLQVSLKTAIQVLSPGQQQRLSIVRALATRPDVIVLDEPMAALDPAARLSVIEELQRARNERPLTIIVSSHIINDLERYCSHLAIVESGRIAAFESMEVFGNFVRVTVRGEEPLLQSCAFVEARHVRVSGSGERAVVVAGESVSALEQSLPRGVSLHETTDDLESVVSEWMR